MEVIVYGMGLVVFLVGVGVMSFISWRVISFVLKKKMASANLKFIVACIFAVIIIAVVLLGFRGMIFLMDRGDEYESNKVYIKGIEDGDTITIKAFVKSGSNPKHLDEDFEGDPLFIAVKHKRFGSAKILLKFGADPNQKSHGGLTPYELARETNQTEIVNLFNQQASLPPARR